MGVNDKFEQKEAIRTPSCEDQVMEPAAFGVNGVMPDEMERVTEQATDLAAERRNTTQAITDLDILQSGEI